MPRPLRAKTPAHFESRARILKAMAHPTRTVRPGPPGHARALRVRTDGHDRGRRVHGLQAPGRAARSRSGGRRQARPAGLVLPAHPRACWASSTASSPSSQPTARPVSRPRAGRTRRQGNRHAMEKGMEGPGRAPAVFLAFFWLPVGQGRFDNAVIEALALAKWYAQEHVLLCLVPAFFIAGAIAVFVSQGSGHEVTLAPGPTRCCAYGVASCSAARSWQSARARCMPAVRRHLSGWAPASARPLHVSLFSGPAINVLAIVLTARIGARPEAGHCAGGRRHRSSASSSACSCTWSSAGRKRAKAAAAKGHLPEPDESDPAPVAECGSTSPRWWASWSSPTGASPRPNRPGSGTPSGRRSGWLSSGLRAWRWRQS